MIWAAGFAEDGEGGPGARALVAFLVAVAATWGTALLDPKDPAVLRRLARAARERRWRTLADELPAWLLAIPFVLGAWAVVCAAGPETLATEGADGRALATAVVLFLARDLAIILWLSLGARARRADLLAVVLLAFGYVLVPLVLSAAQLKPLAAMFYPDPGRSWTSAVSALVQALLAGALLLERWRARALAVEADPG
jgi:hypothetical protein